MKVFMAGSLEAGPGPGADEERPTPGADQADEEEVRDGKAADGEGVPDAEVETFRVDGDVPAGDDVPVLTNCIDGDIAAGGVWRAFGTTREDIPVRAPADAELVEDARSDGEDMLAPAGRVG